MARIAIIRKEKCYPDKCQNFCGKMCPRNRLGEKCIIIDKKAFIDEGLCIGCGICEKCPFKAISIVNLPENLKEPPIYRFLPNGFSLYRLPIPRFGAITGIIGRNGIGKTTSIKILSGLIPCNISTERFRGTEGQAYLEKLKNKEIEVSYKPQRIEDLINFRGKVIDLLKQFDERKKLNKIIDELELNNILDNNVSELSGGELQKIAIACCTLKKADVYFFDEPSSYLDIKQRLNISKFIRNLIEENIAIIIIEHDLMALDYVSDFIYFMYGKESCYGIVSQIKTTKAGINTYLEGYSKDENIRFRSKPVKFEVMAKEKLKLHQDLTSWDNFKKTLRKFTLEAENGEIKLKETIGILGPNGIGKTTFIKAVAEKLNLKISYKPQYLNPEDILVKDFLKNSPKDLIASLELENILERNLKEISGGELQRAFIASTLSKEADIYLLDEPSAYLDVEQRLALAKILELIRLKEKAAIIVDHDLLFIDHISNRLIVFSGIPGIHGISSKTLSMEEGMNKLLKEMNITVRRDEESGRPRINKIDSVKDREQKEKGKYYYI